MSEATETYLWVVTHPMLWIFLGLTALFFVVQWLVNPRPEASDQKRGFDTAGWMRRHYVAIVFAIGGAAIVAAIYFYVAEVGIAVARLVDRLRVGAAEELAPEEAKNLAYGVAVLLGAVVAAATIPFTLLRTWINERSTTAQEQGLITDRINKAVEGLGAEKEVNRMGRTIKYTEVMDEQLVSVETFEWEDAPFIVKEKQLAEATEFGSWTLFSKTQPNLEVRIGAIYALERISQDSARDHIQIMEILCAYIRENAGREDVPLPDGDPTPKKWKEWAETGQEHPRLDVDVALKVIERRAEERKQLETGQGYRLGLERAPLRKIILSQRDLTGADLRNAELQGASLIGTEAQNANFGFTNLQGAQLTGAQLHGANFEFAKLQGAYLGSAQLPKAKLACAKLQGVNLGNANLQGAYLGLAKLQGAYLGGATLQRANLGGAKFNEDTELKAAFLQGSALRSVDFTLIPQISGHLHDIFADASVTLPGGHGPEHESWPAHWPKFVLGKDFETQWRKWQADPDNYTPPEPPKPDA